MKKNILVLLLFPIFISAQNYVIPLWENEIPNSKVIPKSVVDDPSNSEYFYSVTRPEISVYLPTNRNLSGRAMLVIPGGGYWKVTYSWEGTDVAKWLNANGIAAIVLKYRLPKLEFDKVLDKSPLLDANRAMRIIRANADEWNIDKNKIGVIGFSAGGHLASSLATHYDEEQIGIIDSLSGISSRPDFTVLMYPVITMNKEFAESGSRKNLLGDNPSEELVEYYSNEKQVTSSTPPTFIVHASDDNVVPVKNSLFFFEALQKNKVKTEMHIYETGGHGFALANNNDKLKTWRELLLLWLRNLN
jgi:acetyl esterase/lipase